MVSFWCGDLYAYRLIRNERRSRHESMLTDAHRCPPSPGLRVDAGIRSVFFQRSVKNQQQLVQTLQGRGQTFFQSHVDDLLQSLG